MPKTIEDHCNEEACAFVGVTHDLSCAEFIKDAIRDYKFWAWIRHEPDVDNGSEHIHFMLKTNGSRKIRHVADKLQIPPNFIQVLRNEVGMARYFLHLDDDEKIKYTVYDVHTNQHFFFRNAERGTVAPPVLSVFEDFKLVRSGAMPADDFVKKHEVDIEKLSFYQRVKLFDSLVRFIT